MCADLFIFLELFLNKNVTNIAAWFIRICRVFEEVINTAATLLKKSEARQTKIE